MRGNIQFITLTFIIEFSYVMDRETEVVNCDCILNTYAVQ